MPAVLRPRQRARVHRVHEPRLRLEQEGGRPCAQQLLLGLLPDAGGGRPPWRPDRRGEGHPAVRLRLGLPHRRHPAARPPQRRAPGLHDLLTHPHGLAPRRVLSGADQPAVPEGARERASVHLQHRGGRLPVWDAGDRGRGLPPPGPVRLAKCLLLLGWPHAAVGVLRVQVPTEWKRPHPGLGHLGARPADVQAHQSSLETAFPEAFSLETFPSSKGWVFNVVPWLVAIPASLFSGFLSDHLINQAAPAGTQQGPSGPQHKWADGTVSPSPPLRLQDHHRAEVHAGREGRDEPLWTPVCSWDPRGLTSSGPTQKAFGGCPRSVLGAGLAALSASPSCVGGFSVPPSLARGPGCFPLSLTSGTGLSRSLASHIPRSGGLSSVRHGLCPATPLLPQVMGLGLSSVFALCLGHTSSFCTSVVFASASIGLQTFNHSGISVNIQDLAPSCAGFLFGVANTAGALAGVVGVCLGGYLLETTGSWASMFNLVAAVGSLGLCTFLLFGEAQRVDLSPAHEDL
ncbi:solute carrier family 17 member 9 isoform X4 [Mustela putorius furo]|uniref:Solute carrier family 17 member 9 isoform X4 n=1 Tax=Mustela putorius furo TaxID=9669 RepID=A0A8U0UU44_MUSPF|nr:solute carrier family 17 member 9 isoform X4 [Mustela putorius furo]XP_044926487.1 solute carrier family 17 member 9 isoform X4 [Mustela putorius furo]